MSSRIADSSLRLPPFLDVDTTRGCDSAAVEGQVLWLFDALRDPLLRYVCSFGLSVSEGEDVVQDVFLALFKHLRGDGARTNLRGWVFRVAHNLALRHRARRRRAPDGVDAGEAGDFVRDPGRDPEQQLARRRQLARATAVLGALSDTDRQCMVLRGSGLRYREIAGILGISLGSVAKSLTRSIARVQRAIGD